MEKRLLQSIAYWQSNVDRLKSVLDANGSEPAPSGDGRYLYTYPDGSCFTLKHDTPGTSLSVQWFPSESQANWACDRANLIHEIELARDKIELLREQLKKVRTIRLPEPGEPFTDWMVGAARIEWRWNFEEDGETIYQERYVRAIRWEIPGKVVEIKAADPEYAGFFCLDERGRVIR